MKTKNDTSSNRARGFSRPGLLALITLFALSTINSPLSTVFAAAASPPVITGVTASQRAGTKLVDIAYTISDADSTNVNIGILVSKDSGATFTVPATSFTGNGAPGPGIAVTATPSAKTVVWDAGSDWNGHFTSRCRVRVLANDSGLVFIPAGSYLRGNPPALGDTDITDAPQHSVVVSAFLMDSTLVTGGKWNLVKEAWADSHGYTFTDAEFKAIDHPVQTISWFDSVKWCNARSEMEGLTPAYYTDAGFTTVYRTGSVAPFVKPGVNGYRLPTEAEWEKAARGGAAGHRFPWSDVNTITHSQANYFSSAFSYAYDTSPTQGYHPTYNDGTFPYTSPVGSFAANGYGLSDMAGNVYQWCWDLYGSTYYASGQTDPQGPISGSIRVLRGNSWGSSAYVARCANRLSNSPSSASNGIGFRCVRGL